MNIWKFELATADRQTVEMPAGAKIDRRNRLMDKSLETSRKAERAESAACYAGTAVLGRDPEAIEELTRQLEAAELERERIKAIKARIEELRAKRGREAIVLEEEWGTYEEDPEADRLRVQFSRRLTKDEFKSVLQEGFRWSRHLEAFQRHLNDSGRWAAQRVVERLAGVRLVFADGKVSTEPEGGAA